MKLYNAPSPNGLRVDAFLKEKGLELPVRTIDLQGGESRREAYLKINPLGEVPALELDDGRVLTESLAICRYLEALHPTPALFGTGPEEQAFVEMWTRRIELRLFSAVGDIGLHEFEFFKDKIEQVPAYAAAKRRDVPKRFAWLDGELADGRPFIAGDTFTVADIAGMAALMVCAFAQLPIPDELTHVQRWAAAMKSRPSWPLPN